MRSRTIEQRGSGPGRATARRGALALLLGLALAAAGPARAQTAATVRAEIENTQAAIDRAGPGLHCPPGDDDGLACTYYGQAVSLQTSARASFSSGFLRDALALTFRARDRVGSALRVDQDAAGGDFVHFSLERTDALLEQVAPPVRDSNLGRAQRLLADAYDLERRARTAVDGGRSGQGLRTTFQARDRALTALRLADVAAAATPDNARVLLERTDDLLRTEAWLADAGASAGPYGRAIELQGHARGRLEAGEPRAAIAYSLQSRDALARAFARADRPLGRSAVARALSDNATALASARQRAAHDPAVRDRLARAEEHHRQAQEHFRAGHFALALAELHASREALTRSLR